RNHAFFLERYAQHRHIYSFPTRRSSDLAEFESTIANAGDDLTYFASDDSPIQQNIQRRKEHLTKLEEVRGELDTMIEEFSNQVRSEEHTSELQSRFDLVCRLLLEKKKIK